MVNKVVATFLREHPDRKRAQEELDELDKRNTVKTDSVSTCVRIGTVIENLLCSPV